MTFPDAVFLRLLGLCCVQFIIVGRTLNGDDKKQSDYGAAGGDAEPGASALLRGE